MFLLGQTIYYLDHDFDDYLVGQIIYIDPTVETDFLCEIVVNRPGTGARLHIPDVRSGRPGEPGRFITVRQYLESQLDLDGAALDRAREDFFGSDPA